jgi:hypothetical protein
MGNKLATVAAPAVGLAAIVVATSVTFASAQPPRSPTPTNPTAQTTPTAASPSRAATTTNLPATTPQPTPTNLPTPTSPASGNAVFEVTGTGSVYTIDWAAPDPQDRVYDANLPWSRSKAITAESGQLLQVVAIGKDQPGPGCRITLNGKVVAEKPIGGDANCEFAVP